MERKYLYIIAIGGIVLVLFGFIWFFGRSPKPSANADKPLAIPGLNGQKVQTKDFVVDSQVYGNVAVLYSDSNLGINYDRTEYNFAITFSGATKEEITAYRNKAESLLITKLGITQSEACNLSVGEIIVNYEALDLSRQVYPLSFCPGGGAFLQ